MAQSLAAVYVHLVWSTKDRAPIIPSTHAERLYEYLGGIAREHGSSLLHAGGIEDHIHLLVALGREVSIADLVMHLKKSSSKWLKEFEPGFAWQAGYGAFSIGVSGIEDTARYIQNQREHHRVKSFQDEFRAFCARHGVEIDERYVWG